MANLGRVRGEAGSAILNEFRAAMQWQRAGGWQPRAQTSARSFAAAESNRLTAGWLTWDASINALLLNALPVLRARSRQWARNSGPGRRFLGLVRNGMVGPTGFTLQMRCGDWVQTGGKWVWKLDKLANDAIEASWNKWCLAGNCEVTGRFSYADVCKLQGELLARDGEYLAKRLRGADNEWGYTLQLLAIDRLFTQHEVMPAGGAVNEVRMGVERDSAGRALRYSILKWNPGDTRGAADYEQVPARDILHDFVAIDAEQARGVPWAHAILLGANMLAAFAESAVYAARQGANQMGFYTQAPGPDSGPIKTAQDLGAKVDPATGQLMTDMEPGALQLLPPGVGYVSNDPHYPTDTYDPFVKSHKRDMASGLEVAYHNLASDMESVNYSSGRIGELGERDNWRGLAHRFIGANPRIVFMDWLEMSLLKGAIVMPGGAKLPVAKFDKFAAGATFQGRGWDWVDPLKEVNAAAIARKEGFATRSQIVASKGGDFEDNVLQIAQENQILADNNVTLGDGVADPAAVLAADTAQTAAEGK